jgi:hypothetical protein
MWFGTRCWWRGRRQDVDLGGQHAEDGDHRGGAHAGGERDVPVPGGDEDRGGGLESDGVDHREVGRGGKRAAAGGEGPAAARPAPLSGACQSECCTARILRARHAEVLHLVALAPPPSSAFAALSLPRADAAGSALSLVDATTDDRAYTAVGALPAVVRERREQLRAIASVRARLRRHGYARVEAGTLTAAAAAPTAGTATSASAT